MLLFFAAGCGAPLVRTVNYDRELLEAGTSYAPTGPFSAGPMPKQGGVALQARVAASAHTVPTSVRADGSPGEWSLGDGGTLRLSVGATDWFEVGLDAEVSDARLARPLSTDLSAHPAARWMSRGGPSIRMAGPVDGPVRAGGQVEAELVSLPLRRTETTTITTTSFGQEGAEPETVVDTFQTGEESELFAVTARAGAFVRWTTPLGVELAAGALVQTVPVFPGYARQHWECRGYADGSQDCDPEPDSPPDLVYRFTGTPWVEVDVPAGPVTVVAEGWVNGFGDRAGAYGGGSLGVQWVPRFGEEPDRP